MSFYAEILGALGLKEIGGMLDYNIINYGGKAVYVDGFSSIVKIDPLQIVLLAKKNRISIEGEMSVYQLEQSSMIIKGKIVSIIVEEMGKKL